MSWPWGSALSWPWVRDSPPPPDSLMLTPAAIRATRAKVAALSSSVLRASSAHWAASPTEATMAAAASSPPVATSATTAGNSKRVRDHAEDAPESHEAPPTKKVYDMFAPRKGSNQDITAPPVASTSSQVPSAVAPGDASVLHKKRQCSTPHDRSLQGSCSLLWNCRS